MTLAQSVYEDMCGELPMPSISQLEEIEEIGRAVCKHNATLLRQLGEQAKTFELQNALEAAAKMIEEQP